METRSLNRRLDRLAEEFGNRFPRWRPNTILLVKFSAADIEEARATARDLGCSRLLWVPLGGPVADDTVGSAPNRVAVAFEQSAAGPTESQVAALAHRISVLSGLAPSWAGDPEAELVELLGRRVTVRIRADLPELLATAPKQIRA